jgi:DNA-binding XRE family transcriptional regulator
MTDGMPKTSVVKLGGREYVILPRAEYERLAKLARVAELPALSGPDVQGHYAAVEYARKSIARDVVRQRVALGLNQRELARRAGVRVETLCRIETGKHTASTATLARLARALQRARKEGAERKRAPRRRRSAP